MTWNVAFERSGTLTLAGGDEIVGATFVTVSAALLLVTLPAEFVTTTLNTAPLSASVGGGDHVGRRALAPGMFTPSRRHWYVSGSVLVAVTAKEADCPSATERACGCAVMTGAAELTVSVAFALVVEPTEFVSTALNTAPLSMSIVGLIEYVAAVAPTMFVPLRRH